MKSRVIKAFVFSLVTAVSLLSSCGIKSSYFQKQVPIPNAKWEAKFMPAFALDIQDTAAKYAFFLLVRHDESYPNSNLWFRLKMKEPGAKTWTDGPRMEVDFANPDGQWLGRNMGSIWEYKVRLDPKSAPVFKHAGSYEMKVEQLMRYNPLPGVLNVGLIIERI